MKLLTPDEGLMAIRSARGAIEHVCAKKTRPAQKLTPVFNEKRGVFVTLTENGELRGCIGLPYPVMPLGKAIEYAAGAAALEDPRFPPVRADELERITVEVTILTVPVPLEGDPLERPGRVRVGKHGLIVRSRGTSGLLLPQVATEYGWDARTFLDHTCMKAGLAGGCWSAPSVEVLTFEGQIFTEGHAGTTV
ncbi:MAG: TIGR00296 family protein [Methanoregula sp.]|jgi:hypothetical protein